MVRENSINPKPYVYESKRGRNVAAVSAAPVPIPKYCTTLLRPPRPTPCQRLSLSVFAEVGVTDIRSDVELGRLDIQLGGLIDCCSYRARSEYQASMFLSTALLSHPFALTKSRPDTRIRARGCSSNFGPLIRSQG